MPSGMRCGIEDDGGGDHRPGQRPAARLVDAGDGAAVELQLGRFQLEGRHRSGAAFPMPGTFARAVA